MIFYFVTCNMMGKVLEKIFAQGDVTDGVKYMFLTKGSIPMFVIIMEI